jgi:TRAP-type C4-dicarboxylate transport system substrate-binding protein
MFRTMFRAAATLAVVSLAAGSAGAQQFTMKLSSPTVNDQTHEYMKAFKAGVEERSKGRIKVEIYPANQLGQIPATVDGVALGTIEMAIPAVGFFIGLEPRFQTLEASGLFESMEHGNKVLADAEFRKRLATFGDAKGVEPLFAAVYAENFYITNKTLNSLADFKGFKVRVPGAAPVYTEPLKRLGAVPLAMPLGEVLPALQNKAIDGSTMNYPVAMAFKYYDVAKSMTRMPGGFQLVAGVVNRSFMKSLGPELEAIVREESIKAEAKYGAWALELVERQKDAWSKAGGRIVSLSTDDAKKYQDTADAAVATVVSQNAKMKEDLEAIRALAGKHR